MSQGIQERNLPVAESIGEGDKVRIVTSAGNSKNIDASQIGGGGNLVLTETIEELDANFTRHTLSATYNEMMNVIRNGGSVRAVVESTNGGIAEIYSEDITLRADTAPFQVVDTTESGFENVGYYLNDVFAGTTYNFYSATPDGVMTYNERR